MSTGSEWPVRSWSSDGPVAGSAIPDRPGRADQPGADDRRSVTAAEFAMPALSRHDPRHSLDPERLSPPFAMGDFRQRLARLLPLPDGIGGVAKRQDRHDVQIFRDANELFGRWAPASNPIAAHSSVPGHQEHILDGAARVRDREPGWFDGNDNREWRLRDVRSTPSHRTELAQHIGVLHHHEAPGLLVRRARRQPTGLQHPAYHVFRDRLVTVAAHGQERADGLEYVHGLSFRMVTMWKRLAPAL